MNFLEALPTELWREILFQIPTTWIYGAHLSNDPLFRSGSYLMNNCTIEDTQIERAALVLVCKALCPLAEELLFTEVNLRSFSSASIFSKIAEPNGEKRRGYWTKRISVPRPLSSRPGGWREPRERWEKIFQSIQAACPRLVTLHLQETGFKSNPNLMLPNSLMGRLTTLTISEGVITPEILSFISSSCPQLNCLSIGYVKLQDGAYNAVSFPRVRQLTLASYIHTLSNPLESITFPRLEWLFFHARIIFQRERQEFILRHKSSLVGIEIGQRMAPLPRDFAPSAELPSYISECPNLRTLSIEVDSNSLDVSTQVHHGPHANLETLILKLKPSVEYDAPSYARYFSQERFPSLATVQLVHQKVLFGWSRCSLVDEDISDFESDFELDLEHSTGSEDSEVDTTPAGELRHTEDGIVRRVKAAVADQVAEAVEAKVLGTWKDHFPHTVVKTRHVPFDLTKFPPY